MAAANAQVLKTLGDLWRTRGDATVRVDSGRAQRVLHVRSGELVAAESDLLTERLGVQLVAEGALDAALVAPLVTAARASGRQFGQQLVAERLIGEAELVCALERQLTARFDRAVQMAGTVSVSALAAVRPSARRPLAAAVVASFRRLPVDVASAMVAMLPPHNPRMQEDQYSAQQLELTPAEERYFRQLASGMDASGVLDRATDYECALRLCAALVGMGALPTEVEDPIAQFLKTA